jgi:hypothetical protein
MKKSGHKYERLCEKIEKAGGTKCMIMIVEKLFFIFF